MVELPAGGSPCGADADPDKPNACSPVATTNVGGLGRATVYKAGSLKHGGLGVQYRLALEIDGRTWMSTVQTFQVDDCYLHGNCTSATDLKQSLRAISIGGAPAVALEIHVHRLHTDNSPPTHEETRATRFVICGRGTDRELRCASIEHDDSCVPRLSRDGELSYRCREHVTVVLGP